MEDSKPRGKESTILSKSEDTLKLLGDFQSRLDKQFSRGIKPEEKATGRPQASNILDEILENQEMIHNHLASIVSFVSSEVLPKIG